MKNREYFALFLISTSAIITEVALTKIFAVLFFHHFAFLIISIALLGYAVSGVYLSIKENYQAYYERLSLYALTMGVAIAVSFKIILSIPLDFTAFPKFEQFFYLLIYLIFLLIPFFLAGFILSLIFSVKTYMANKLYFYDLTGAAVGAAIFGFGISFLGGQGIIVLAACFAVLASLLFDRKVRPVLILILIIFVLLLPFTEKVFKFHYPMAKRNFLSTLKKIEYSRWSPIFKIDVAKYSKHSKIIWIDAGTNQSFLNEYKKDLRKDENVPRRVRYEGISIPYQINPKGRYLIIGPAGGLEVFIALSYRPKLIHAVELDPVIVDIVKNKYSKFIGHLYRNPRIKLVNEEGRSFVKRSKLKYDVIQEVNNCTPAAIASGVLNFQETYILTVEAFEDYWEHLSPNGIISLHTMGSARLLSIAKELLQRKGIRNFENHIVIVKEGPFRELFMLKKKPFSEKEISIIEDQIAWANTHTKFRVKMRPIYLPHRKGGSQFIKELLMKSLEEIKSKTNLKLEPPTDDKPFFYSFLPLFSFEVKGKLGDKFFRETIEKYHFQATCSLFAIFVFLFILSFFLIPYPLYIFQRKGIRERRALRFLIFFAAIGLAFIFIEIVFIKKFILFLGAPVYSITIVIASLLLSAGIGSALSAKINPEKVRFIALIIFSLLILYILILNFIFEKELVSPFFIRLVLSLILIFLPGVFMGMIFPAGLKLVRRTSVNLVPWAWGINGFFTVIGSALTVVLTVSFGFNFTLLAAAFLYLLAGFVVPLKL